MQWLQRPGHVTAANELETENETQLERGRSRLYFRRSVLVAVGPESVPVPAERSVDQLAVDILSAVDHRGSLHRVRFFASSMPWRSGAGTSI